MLSGGKAGRPGFLAGMGPGGRSGNRARTFFDSRMKVLSSLRLCVL